MERSLQEDDRLIMTTVEFDSMVLPTLDVLSPTERQQVDRALRSLSHSTVDLRPFEVSGYGTRYLLRVGDSLRLILKRTGGGSEAYEVIDLVRREALRNYLPS